jgi:hypothetical protein
VYKKRLDAVKTPLDIDMSAFTAPDAIRARDQVAALKDRCPFTVVASTGTSEHGSSSAGAPMDLSDENGGRLDKMRAEWDSPGREEQAQIEAAMALSSRSPGHPSKSSNAEESAAAQDAENLAHATGRPGGNTSLSDTLGESDVSRTGTKDLLAELFQPPFDIMMRSTFEAAKAAAQGKKKWVLVNIQSDKVFASLQLNRDTWSDALVKDFVRDACIFWQQLYNNEEGNKVVRLRW